MRPLRFAHELTLDEIVEVTFTVSPRVRRIAAHDPETLPWIEYYRQVFWSSVVDFPDDETFAKWIEETTLGTLELAAGEKVVLSLQLPEGSVDVFDPVVNMSLFMEIKGESVGESQSLSFIMTRDHAPAETLQLRPGPLQLTLENRSNVRALPGIWVVQRQGSQFRRQTSPLLDRETPSNQSDIP